MEGSNEKREEPKPYSEMMNNQMTRSPFMPAFQNAHYPNYYPAAYSGVPMSPISSSFPLYCQPPKPKRQLNKFTIFEKLQAIERVNFGETKAHVARSINVAESTLRGWFKNGDKLRTLYETEEMPMQASTSSPNEYSISAMYNLPTKIPKKEGESCFTDTPPVTQTQAKSFNNYNYSWLEFYRNFEKLPLQYFDTSMTSNKIDEGPELGKRFLRWMEDRMAKADKNFHIHMGHLEAFRNILNDIFRVQVARPTQERRHIVGDDEEDRKEVKAPVEIKVQLTKPVVERKHIVGDDEEIKDEPKSLENTDEDEDDEQDAF